GGGTEGGEVLTEEVRLRQRDERELVCSVELDPAAGGSQRPIERGRVAREAERVFVDEDLREAGPQLRPPGGSVDGALEPALEPPIGRGSDLLAVGEILKLPLDGSEAGVVLLPARRPHGMDEHTVAVGDRRDDASRDVVLGLEKARRLEIPAVR